LLYANEQGDLILIIFSFTSKTIKHLRLSVKAAEELMKKGFKVCMLLEPSFVDLIAINDQEMRFIEVKSGKKWKFSKNEQIVRKLCKAYGISYFVFDGEFHKM